MMRALYSGVSGLRVHQTKMDVIGNNISNVNTVGFKASSATFSDVLYQTTQSASGPNPSTGTAGTNAMQIGLGSNLASITTNITKIGGSQRTDNPFDVMIEGDGFFIVNNGNGNYFTKAGSFNVDTNGTLCTPTGATVMGWQPDPNDPKKCVADRVSALKIMSPQNQFSEPEGTTEVYLHGNIDSMDTALHVKDDEESEKQKLGKIIVMPFFDNLGNSYNAEMDIRSVDDDGGNNSKYQVRLTNVYDSKGKSIFLQPSDDPEQGYDATSITSVEFGMEGNTFEFSPDPSGVPKFEGEPITLIFDGGTGKFKSVGSDDADTQNTSISFKVNTSPNEGDKEVFEKINIDFSSITMFNNSGVTTVESTKGNKDTGAGTGREAGTMSGVSIDQAGKVFGVYDNGDQKILGQIAIAKFSNPAGLEAVGNNMFAATQNSGDFNGIGEDITSDGGKMNTGVLEMSNVDLSAQFTDMITTQRGFQANSRIITTSDTLLEELINLKR